MKKLLVIALMLTFAVSNAQIAPATTPKKITFEEKVEILYNRLTRGLTLEADQIAKIKPLIETIIKTREAAVEELKSKKTSGTPLTKEELAARRAKREADEAAFKAEMKKILTPQQYTQFELGLTRKRPNGDAFPTEKEAENKP